MLHLHTERLELVEFSAYNVSFIIELLNSPGWLQFIGDRNVRNPDDAKAYLLNGPMKSYVDNGFGALLVKERGSNQPIGMCGLFRRDYLNFPDIGFAFLPQFEGLGYAFEAASAVLNAASASGYQTIGAILTPDNSRSRQLLDRLGFVSKGLIVPPGSTEELVLMETFLDAQQM
ncbi:MAG: GNAT family N-acetyltransferase [Taibaiella sp.]|nr:GNAT family N-acetyltransferase [Taibaiella sp.]